MEWALALVAVAVLGVGAISGRLSGTPITPAILFVGFGLVFGAQGVDAIDLSSTGSAVRVLAESTLSFFGLGPQPGQGSVSLGQLIELARSGARQGNWWLVVFPCGALVLLAVCINFIGDGLRDALDPKLDKGH